MTTQRLEITKERLLADAAQRVPHAVNNLGVLYARGRYIEKDLGVAKQLFVHAARLGVPVALFNLGSVHEEQGDVEGATAFCRQAAQQGDVRAQALMGAF